ncbi:MAG: hypothetical protein ACP5KN_05560 [Armatimonadota bacterium]
MSLRAKTAIIVVVALIAIGGFNYVIHMDPTHLAARGVGKDPHSHGDHDQEQPQQQAPQEDLTRPMGPKDAPILIQACYTQEGLVHDEFRPILKEIVADYKGLVRVEFLDARTPENRELIDRAAEGMLDGLIINGEVVKETPGTAFGMANFQGLASFNEWSVDELRRAIEHELKQKGIEFTSHIGEETEVASPLPPPLPPDSHGH